MRFHSLSAALAFSLLTAGPIVSAYAVTGSSAEKRHVGSLASLASKLVRDIPIIEARQDVPPPDEFGPWDSSVDEFGSWADKVKREPHHTEGQIAAKEKAANSANSNNSNNSSGNRASTATAAAAAAATTTSSASTCNKKRHHTEGQIAAKEKAAAAAAAAGDC